MISELDAAIIALEARMPRSSGRKDEAILAELGLKPVRYYQLLVAAIQKPEVIAASPVEVHRIRRGIERRAAARSRRVVGD